MTCEARELVIGKKTFNAIYVFIYTYSWAQVVTIRIACYFCEKQKKCNGMCSENGLSCHISI